MRPLLNKMLPRSHGWSGPPQSAPITPTKRNQDGIIGAMQYAAYQGGGAVFLEPKSYAIGADILGIDGVELIGERGAFTFTGDVPDSNFQPRGGTVFDVTSAVTAYKYNAVDQGSVSANIGQRSIGGIKLKNISIVGGANGIVIGAVNDMGAMFSEFENLYFYNQLGVHASFENFMHCTWKNLYGRNTLASAPGGFYWRCSLNSQLLPGNSQIMGEIYSYATSRLSRQIVFESRGGAGCQMNEMVVAARLQANRFTNGTPDTAAVNLTNGSGNFVLQNPAHIAWFPIGMPIAFSGSAPSGFALKTIYFVSGNDGVNTITVSTAPLSTGVVNSGSTGAFNILRGGFPSLEVHANSNSLFTNCDFGQHADLECNGNLVSASFRRTRTSRVGILENYASNSSTALVFRDASAIEVALSNLSPVTTDADANSFPNIINKVAGRRTLTASETLVPQRHMCDVYVDSASEVVITVPTDLPYGFKCNFVQVGAGVVRIAPISGSVTVVGRNGLKTAGQNAKIQLMQRAINSYVVAGDAAV